MGVVSGRAVQTAAAPDPAGTLEREQPLRASLREAWGLCFPCVKSRAQAGQAASTPGTARSFTGTPGGPAVVVSGRWGPGESLPRAHPASSPHGRALTDVAAARFGVCTASGALGHGRMFGIVSASGGCTWPSREPGLEFPQPECFEICDPSPFF